MSNSFYTFPALRGKQGKYDYYLLLCPLHLIPRIFLFDELQVPSEWQPRPSLNLGAVDKLAHYLQTHRDDYVLAPMVATSSTPVEFTASNHTFPEIGSVTIPLHAVMVIQDGQHRRAAIEQLLVNSTGLTDNAIAIMLFSDPTLDRSPAIFAALNQQYVQGNASRRVAHDSVRPLASVTRHLAEVAPVFQGRVDYERTTISNRSIALFTINAVFQATQALLGVSENEGISEMQAGLALQFWVLLGEIIPEWARVITNEVSPAELRPNYVHVHSVTLLAIGRAGAALITAHPNDWQEKLAAWRTLDWSRQNPAWEGRAMLHGRMSKTHASIQLTTNLLKMRLGLPLTEKEKGVEKVLDS